MSKRHDLGCNFWDREGRKTVTPITPKIVPFSVAALAVVANKA